MATVIDEKEPTYIKADKESRVTYDPRQPYTGPLGGIFYLQPSDLHTTACSVPDPPFERAWKNVLRDIQVLHDKKRNDYTGGNEDALVNYRQASDLIGIPVENGMLMRMQEKMTRLGNLFTGTKQMVADESSVDALRDIAIIAMLIMCEFETREDAVAWAASEDVYRD